MKRRSGEAMAALGRKAGPMRHRLEPRGGTKNEDYSEEESSAGGRQMLDDDSPLWDTIMEVHDILAEMSPDDRVDFIHELLAGYCVHCGSAGSGRCQCQNDE